MKAKTAETKCECEHLGCEKAGLHSPGGCRTPCENVSPCKPIFTIYGTALCGQCAARHDPKYLRS